MDYTFIPCLDSPEYNSEAPEWTNTFHRDNMQFHQAPSNLYSRMRQGLNQKRQQHKQKHQAQKLGKVKARKEAEKSQAATVQFSRPQPQQQKRVSSPAPYVPVSPPPSSPPPYVPASPTKFTSRAPMLLDEPQGQQWSASEGAVSQKSHRNHGSSAAVSTLPSPPDVISPKPIRPLVRSLDKLQQQASAQEEQQQQQAERLHKGALHSEFVSGQQVTDKMSISNLCHNHNLHEQQQHRMQDDSLWGCQVQQPVQEPTASPDNHFWARALQPLKEYNAHPDSHSSGQAPLPPPSGRAVIAYEQEQEQQQQQLQQQVEDNAQYEYPFASSPAAAAAASYHSSFISVVDSDGSCLDDLGDLPQCLSPEPMSPGTAAAAPAVVVSSEFEEAQVGYSSS